MYQRLVRIMGLRRSLNVVRLVRQMGVSLPAFVDLRRRNLLKTGGFMLTSFILAPSLRSLTQLAGT